MYALYYNDCMDITIRNVDDEIYRRVKARAALEGRTIGDVLNEAMRTFLDRSSQNRELAAIASRESLRAQRVRRAWQQSRRDKEVYRSALEWLDRHPSHVPEIDELWREALEGRGPLARWLDGDESALESAGQPARAILASHPFVVYLRCSLQTTSAA